MNLATRSMAIPSLLLFFLNCGYHRLDRMPKLSSKDMREVGVSIRPFEVNCLRAEYGWYFRQALEARVITATNWKLVPIHQPTKWVFHGFIESCETYTVGFLTPDRLGLNPETNPLNPASNNGPTPFRSESRLKASIELCPDLSVSPLQ